MLLLFHAFWGKSGNLERTLHLIRPADVWTFIDFEIGICLDFDACVLVLLPGLGHKKSPSRDLQLSFFAKQLLLS
jgi:hypothetical protein